MATQEQIKKLAKEANRLKIAIDSGFLNLKELKAFLKAVSDLTNPPTPRQIKKLERMTQIERTIK